MSIVQKFHDSWTNGKLVNTVIRNEGKSDQFVVHVHSYKNMDNLLKHQLIISNHNNTNKWRIVELNEYDARSLAKIVSEANDLTDQRTFYGIMLENSFPLVRPVATDESRHLDENLYYKASMMDELEVFESFAESDPELGFMWVDGTDNWADDEFTKQAGPIFSLYVTDSADYGYYDRTKYFIENIAMQDDPEWDENERNEFYKKFGFEDDGDFKSENGGEHIETTGLNDIEKAKREDRYVSIDLPVEFINDFRLEPDEQRRSSMIEDYISEIVSNGNYPDVESCEKQKNIKSSPSL